MHALHSSRRHRTVVGIDFISVPCRSTHCALENVCSFHGSERKVALNKAPLYATTCMYVYVSATGRGRTDLLFHQRATIVTMVTMVTISRLNAHQCVEKVPPALSSYIGLCLLLFALCLAKSKINNNLKQRINTRKKENFLINRLSTIWRQSGLKKKKMKMAKQKSVFNAPKVEDIHRAARSRL